ncbi:Phosphatidate cytidylyltransferase, mitochondrial [Psilocybe cubensis]|uniref:Phosphatidate cytidylyltransferase, mitochondrial n=2 Tax=Psilocybe cubensis TaxID=181762 RepID=A0ACB8GXU5_PSICU|nr:Phosphatidate cytidylyltransferase, mitochondrial [Psilocybe cubensis]KAH9480441.1 Phosphatidate cytidylyltransferase, mitochondrial [Psilocybe cubensis]
MSSLLPSVRSNVSKQVCLRLTVVRSYATETHTSSSSSTTTTTTTTDLPPLPHKANTTKPRLYPRPRPAVSHRHTPLPKLPASFGKNQLLPVSNSTRALLESIVAGFDAPIRYAFAYGSGVFEQDGYTVPSQLTSIAQGKTEIDPNAPMLDFIFAVTHPAHFHSINMHQHPNHYPLHARLLGSSYVSRVQEAGPGVWFNAYVPMNGVTIKYGVTTVDTLCSDLLNWQSLYVAGRMHKPLRIIKDDARVRLTQQVNLTSAVRAALLTLPEEFSETELFERITGFSYSGDPRMALPIENRNKVGNIVRKQGPQFKELYHRLVVGLPGVHWPVDGTRIQQDLAPHARAAHLRKLPSNLLRRVKENYARKGETNAELEADESAYWVHLAGDQNLPKVITDEVSNIVKGPATIQSIKGVISLGLGKTIRYGGAKMSKWWRG